MAGRRKKKMDVLDRMEEQMQENQKLAGYLRHVADLIEVSHKTIACPCNPWIVRKEGMVSFELNIQLEMPRDLYEGQQDKAIDRIIERGPEDDNTRVRKNILGRKRNIE